MLSLAELLELDPERLQAKKYSVILPDEMCLMFRIVVQEFGEGQHLCQF